MTELFQSGRSIVEMHRLVGGALARSAEVAMGAVWLEAVYLVPLCKMGDRKTYDYRGILLLYVFLARCWNLYWWRGCRLSWNPRSWDPVRFWAGTRHSWPDMGDMPICGAVSRVPHPCVPLLCDHGSHQGMWLGGSKGPGRHPEVLYMGCMPISWCMYIFQDRVIYALKRLPH